MDAKQLVNMVGDLSPSDREFTFVTSKKGAYMFHSTLEGSVLDHESLKDKYIATQSELYDAKENYDRLMNKTIVKLLFKLRLLTRLV